MHTKQEEPRNTTQLNSRAGLLGRRYHNNAVDMPVIILFAVVFMLFLFILVRLFSNEDSGTYRPIRRF